MEPSITYIKKHPQNASTFQDGFTLLEVMISFAILSTLLVVIIQSTSETTFFLHKTEQLSIAQKVVINELMRIERENPSDLKSSQGIFPDGHILAGNKWKLIISNSVFLDVVPVTRIRYQVSWFLGKQQHTFESSIVR